jgi:hypothetical protein
MSSLSRQMQEVGKCGLEGGYLRGELPEVK